MSDSLRAKVSKSPKKEVAESALADLESYKALEALSLSEGGKILIETLKQDALSDIDSLCVGYKKLPHAELVALCASLEKSLDTLRAITRASKNKSLAREALADVLDE